MCDLLHRELSPAMWSVGVFTYHQERNSIISSSILCAAKMVFQVTILKPHVTASVRELNTSALLSLYLREHCSSVSRLFRIMDRWRLVNRLLPSVRVTKRSSTLKSVSDFSEQRSSSSTSVRCEIA